MDEKVEAVDAPIEPTQEAAVGDPLAKPLQPDEFLDKWRIIKVLGAGAFGAVYEAQKDGGNWALKVENAETKVRVLKMEVAVLQSLATAGASHTCRVVDTGKTKGLYYVAMTLVGRSLGELRKTYPGSRFTMGCAISVSMQCLEAIQEVHNSGYLHRDLKPANFAIALTKPRHIIIFDFGMCRKFAEGGFHRKPRASAGFRGTLRYASLRAHDCLELSRKDDLESWIYQTIELTAGSLPWSHLSGILEVQEMKQSARQPANRTQLFGGCPKEFLYLMILVDKLDYYDDPKYSQLRGLLRDALTANKLEEFPYDWETTTTKNDDDPSPPKQ